LARGYPPGGAFAALLRHGRRADSIDGPGIEIRKGRPPPATKMQPETYDARVTIE
jgi:hypothetical protein